MKAFITGSRAYGTPRPDSDIDLVVMCKDKETAHKLREVLCPTTLDNETSKYSCSSGSIQLRYKKLNLILCWNKKKYNAWKKGTKKLEYQAILFGPTPRDKAVTLFKQLGV